MSNEPHIKLLCFRVEEQGLFEPTSSIIKNIKNSFCLFLLIFVYNHPVRSIKRIIPQLAVLTPNATNENLPQKERPSFSCTQEFFRYIHLPTN